MGRIGLRTLGATLVFKLPKNPVSISGERVAKKPVGDFGVIGQQKFFNFAAPEEEVFTISLETPPGEDDKKQKDRSGEWPLLDFNEDGSNSTFDRSFRSLDLNATWEAGTGIRVVAEFWVFVQSTIQNTLQKN